jgi:hypothetical protein
MPFRPGPPNIEKTTTDSEDTMTRGTRSLLLFGTVLTLASAARADDDTTSAPPEPAVEKAKIVEPRQNLGGSGESCRARSDCRADLKCVRHTCVEEGDRGARESEEKADTEPFEGTHGYIGMTIGGGGALFALHNSGFYGGGTTGLGAFQASLAMGVLVDRFQLELELSPASLIYFAGGTLPAFQGNMTIGTLAPIAKGLSWPFRIGGGGGFVFSGGVGGFAELRADVMGLVWRNGNLMVQANFPSFRYMFFPPGVSILTWVTNVGVAYAF